MGNYNLNIKKFLREYFGLVPLTGAAITAGTVGGIAFTISLAAGASKEFLYLFNGGNALDSILSLYKEAGSIAGQWIMPAGAAGQFLTYKFKKAVVSVFKK